MQDDITDGVKALHGMGWADPEHTCIVGWSYGGYAALAGAALTPDLYKCVVAIAGVSDLVSMLTWERVHHGANSRALAYWKDVIGDPVRDRDAIEAVSPARLAYNYKADVLLVHGSDDLIVPVDQSNKMESALKRAGKSVNYLRIKGDDHELVVDGSRREMLNELSRFLSSHLKPQ